MTGTPQVSFIMPAWRPRPDWFALAVDSVLSQAGIESELIIVDDGNDEPVAPLLGAQPDPRITVLRVPHGGVGAARNAGIAQSRGRWIRFVDCDDYQSPGGTAHLLELAGYSDGLITYGATLFCDEDLRPVWTMTCDVHGSATIASLCGRLPVRVTSMLFPRRVADLAGDWDPTYPVLQDKEWCLRAFEHAPVRGDSYVMTHYRKHGTSNTQGSFHGLRDNRAVLDAYLESHPELRGTRVEREATAAIEAMAARVHLVRGDRRQAFGHLARAARLAPSALIQEGRQGWAALGPSAKAAIRHRFGRGKVVDRD